MREPAVAGAFYPAGEDQLLAMLDELVAGGERITGALGAVSPHAGYVYSGRAAGALFASVEVPETVVVLGVNHRGIGAKYGLYDEGAWLTPLGEVEIDRDLAEAIKSEAGFVVSDVSSHVHEHSIEVQVPFLQYARKDVRVVPISIGENDYAQLVALGKAIAAAVRAVGREVLVLASSDMTHYESAVDAERKDRIAIERMLALDEEGLWRVVRSQGISMCGVAPATAAIAAVRELGADDARLVQYTTSGEVTGDYNEVVGYAALAFTRET